MMHRSATDPASTFWKVALSMLLITLALTWRVPAADWPTWRCDAARSATTSQQLPRTLRLAWWRDLPANHVAWAEDPRLQFDRSIEPIVVGTTMIVASSRTDSVTALSAETGRQLWKTHVGGPVRLTPVAWEGRVYFGSDDGCFYCLDAADGAVVWKIDVAPTGRRVIGNERLVSVWPVRGGPVIVDGNLFFTAGVWPFEGTLLCRVDLRASEAGAPRYATTLLKDVAPQGHLVATDGHLFIPTGRGVAACVDLRTGRSVALGYGSHGRTDHHLAGAGQMIFHGTKAYHTGVRRVLPFDLAWPVSDGERVFGATGQVLIAHDVARRETYTAKDREGNDKEHDRVPVAWQLAIDEVIVSDAPARLHLRAGHRLYGHRGEVIFAVDLPQEGGTPQVTWRAIVDGKPESMLAAADRLYVVTRQGRIHCFAGEPGERAVWPLARAPLAPADDALRDTVADILKHAAPRVDRISGGYCVVLGDGCEQLAAELVRQSSLQVIAVLPDPRAVAGLRQAVDAAGLYGDRLTVLAGDPSSISLPPYLATFMVGQHRGGAGSWDAAALGNAFRSLRPYGGKAVLALDDASHDRLVDLARSEYLAGAKVVREGAWTVLSRPGPLDGAADWTHEYADAANTLMSRDALVRAPLGVLWFGGPAGRGELYHNRHFWGPGPTVVNGRMFVQGPQRLTAIDIYTGRILWKRKVRAGSGPGRRGTFFDIERQGFHVTAAHDRVYLTYHDHCLALDPETGRTVKELRLPGAADQWGKVRVLDDMLLVTVFRDAAGSGLLPRAVAAVNRYDGNLVWQWDATHGVPLLSVGGGRLYCFDGALKELYDAWRRKGKDPIALTPRWLKALDAASGRPIWEREIERAATWLAYSADHDVVVVSNNAGIDGYGGLTGEPMWQQNEQAPGFGGHPEGVWDKVIVAIDEVIDQRGPGRAFNLVTGAAVLDRHPLTGQTTPWQFTKTGHHCNYAVASPHLLTFRAGQAGFFDRATMGTGRLTGFRSGCRNSLLPAGGVLNAPNYAHACSCAYSVFTSLALVHVPEADLWTYNAYASPTSDLSRFGINFGAPGGRLSDEGTLWLAYPPAGDPSACIEIAVEPEAPRWFRKHTALMSGAGLRWVGAFGATGLARLTAHLPNPSGVARSYTVRLYFGEPDARQVGERVFDVALQGKAVIDDLDVVREAGGARRVLIREFADIAAADKLTVELAASRGETLLCGIEVIRQR